MKMATKPLKQAVIAPSMLALLYPLDGEVPGYSPRAVPRRSRATSARRTSASASRPAPRASRSTSPKAGSPAATIRAIPGPAAACSASSSTLNNRVLDRFSAEERKNIGIHTCPGGDCDSTHSADVDYADLLPSMFKMNAGYFLMQLASEKDKERVYKLIGEHSREDANGVPQVCFIGVINPQNPRVETRAGGVRRPRRWRPSTSPRSGSAPPTIAASRRSASTSSRSTARRTWRATSPSRRSRRASRAPSMASEKLGVA